ncbi:dienelactone hydrolase [Sulfuritortus calidifontis]|uniref:Dienelactone hydrolase n=1 Tax=Sulfuritortus calidifontis TaxID=1914471 RepID=A0A4V2UQR8_9PROT|nr:DUF3530 family protein [Sulfuritortus calidifontis]TCS72175.1 dienelactone hydrolase [Sulfuritortus calidifontis]
MRLITLLFTLFLGLPAAAGQSDYAREKKWADEILPAVLVGDPVWLEGPNRHKFLGLYAEAGNPKAAVIIVHGIGVHPDHGLISPLRQQLAEQGYTTLSLQMPILQADAKNDAYPPLFDEAAQRLDQAAAFLKQKGYRKIALVSHSLGCRMSYRYLSTRPDAPIAAWVAIGNSSLDDYGKLKLPVFDLYGQNDLPAVVENAPRRAAMLKGRAGAVQRQVPGANHFFEGLDANLVEAVRGYLDQAL